MARRWTAPAPGTPDQYELVEAGTPAPGPGEVTLRIVAAGVNPVDLVPTTGADPAHFPALVGQEAAGVVTAVGEGALAVSGPVAVGDEVIVYRPLQGSWAQEMTVPGDALVHKPENLDFPAAANLLAAGTTAAEALHVIGAGPGDVILVHGASGAVGVSLIQQAAVVGATVIGTASEENAGLLARFGAKHVAYGDGLAGRVRALAPEGITAAVDCVGTDEAVDTSIDLLGGTDRFLTIAAFPRAVTEPLPFIAGNMPDSAAYRSAARLRLVELAAEGGLEVPVGRTFPFEQAPDAIALLATGHPGGKIALVV
ncbi:zinc-binding alcohol dehydrogenase family protein [Streptomyces sp. NPDC085479]|uniref:zinc-binding alcohol dehydrogenase family protein n=1 Tax=Streptomyces sp. NPDC085479 TaxID=3365726 RepID=UPI0037D0F177